MTTVRTEFRARGVWLALTMIGVVLSEPVYSMEPAAGAAAGVGTMVTLREGRLTARLVDVPLRQVMRDIGRLSGAEVSWLTPAPDERVSVVIPDLPISEALQRILAGRSFVLFYASPRHEEQLTRIWITAGIDERIHEPPSTPGHTTVSMPYEPDPDRAPPMEAALQTALTGDDLAARLRAIESLAPHARSDPTVRRALSRIARLDRNPQVKDVASAMLGRPR